MSKELQRMIALDGILFLLGIAVALHFTDRGIESWIERYQTLIGALVAVGAAWYAGYWVKRQIETANEQIALAREQNDFVQGFAQPSFWISAPRPNYIYPQTEVRLHCENWNRHPIELREVRCIAPLKHSGPTIIVNDDDEPLNVSVRGTNPRASETSTRVFIILFKDLETNAPPPIGIVLDVRYVIAGTNDQTQQATVFAPPLE